MSSKDEEPPTWDQIWGTRESTPQMLRGFESVGRQNFEHGRRRGAWEERQSGEVA